MVAFVRTVAIGLLVAALLLPAFPAAEAASPIQPGGYARITGTGCTLNFVFDGTGGEVYLGIAGHCVSVGSRVGTTGHFEFGTTVYDNDGVLDFALIRVDSDKEHLVQAAVKGYPTMPTGVTDHTETLVGDRLVFSGYGIGYDTTTVTQENRIGVLVSDNGLTYCSQATIHWGDSGGPVLHAATGKALGIVSHLGLECASWLAGGTVQGAIAKASQDGFPVTLRTV